MQKHPARICYDVDDVKRTQSVSQHHEICARYAAGCLPALTHSARLAARLHDIGKYSSEFSVYLEAAALAKRNGLDGPRRGSVNHSFAAVRFALARWHTGAQSMQSLTCEIIAFAMGAHHGLFDAVDAEGVSGYIHRMEKVIPYDEALSNFLADGADLTELDALFAAAQQEVEAAMGQFGLLCASQADMRFGFSVLARLVLSAVIEADRRDAAEFELGHTLSRFEASPTMWKGCLKHLEAKLAEKPRLSEIDRARHEISRRCRDAAQHSHGIFRLSVPTGGGKTLASLRYALTVAAAQGKKRILLVSPLLTILEQNAQAVRDALGDTAFILEHHSNVVREKPGDIHDELDSTELLTESWDAPIIITTLVQLLNTFFSGKGSCIRRMHALADSVIVVDEVQSLPRNLLSLFNTTMNFLSAVCGTTVVLCSATHPCLETVRHPLHFASPEELVPHDAALYEVFRRTEIIDRRTPSGWEPEALAEFAADCARKTGSLLLICNMKAQAQTLHRLLSAQTDFPVFHLSAGMCMQHRADTLDKINTCLNTNQPVICVATQLVEAGVDFSFGCVIRVLAGLDNIIQAAGRCNRHGKHTGLSPVYVVNLMGEKLGPLKDIRMAQQAATAVLEQQRSAPSADDLSAQGPINAYYRYLYSELPVDGQDFPIQNPATTLYELLSGNARFCAKDGLRNAPYTLVQGFRTAGERFRVFDDNTVDLLVPYGAGREVIADLCSERASRDLGYCIDLLKRAKGFTISVFANEMSRLQKAGGLYSPHAWKGSEWEGMIVILRDNFYSSETGCNREGDTTEYMGV